MGGNRLVLAAMIFAVSMSFIDQTIVSIATPELQKDLSLSSTGVQWVINGYLLSLSALFALGGRLADVMGHRNMLVLGVVTFAGASALCGATPTGDIAETWMIVFRVIQGAGAALLFPAALSIVISSFPVEERGKAMATFFGIAGGLTAVGPIAGGYLTEITWRAIFWVNVPVAIIALVLTYLAKPAQEKHPGRIDYRGAVLIAAGMGLAVLGLQQASDWGWESVTTWTCIVVGMALLAAFVAYELRTESPLINLRIFANRAFAIDNAVMFLQMMAFVPFFFFASMYAQISLGEDASTAGLYLLVFYAGYAVASQIGGRILDREGARRTLIVGCALAAVGLYLLAGQLADLSFDDQWPYVVMVGAGMGLVLAPANTDALNRAARTAYGEVTGAVQTVRNFGSSLGLAVLGSILIFQNKTNIEDSLTKFGEPKDQADRVADAITHAGSGDSSRFSEEAGSHAMQVFGAVQHDFAQAMGTVFYVMAGIMAVAFLVALVLMPGGKVETVGETPA